MEMSFKSLKNTIMTVFLFGWILCKGQRKYHIIVTLILIKSESYEESIMKISHTQGSK